MRCPDCNKFASYEEADPEVENVEVDDTGHVTASVRIVNTCADCGTDLKEATLELEGDVDGYEAHVTEATEKAANDADAARDVGSSDPKPDPSDFAGDHELTAEEGSSERTQRSGYFKKGVFVPAGGRYAKTFYGASVEVDVKCSCGEFDASVTLQDDVQASDMDELT